MEIREPLVDIHCHLLPDLDDGAQTWAESLLMARIAASDGIETIVATPHQLGEFSHNGGKAIRDRTRELQQSLVAQRVPLQVFPGADVRLESDLAARVRSGEVLTLADQGRHVLAQLPADPWDGVTRSLEELRGAGLAVILAHPERHPVVRSQPRRLVDLVERGGLVQVTADSLLGGFGTRTQQMAEWLLSEGLVHFVATGAHGATSRRPLMRQALLRVAQLSGWETAWTICARHPSQIVAGRDVDGAPLRRTRRFTQWFRRRKAG